MPKSTPWFRFYSEAVRDPKVQNLSLKMFKFWTNALCLANENEPRGTLPDAKTATYRMKITPKAYEKASAQLLSKGRWMRTKTER